MAEQLQLPWSMWRAQSQLLGGAKRALVLMVGAAVALPVVALLMRRLHISWEWILALFMALQYGVLTLYAVGIVHRAILRDIQTRMIESHRLTPLTATAVALGYLLGPTQHALALAAVLFVGGAGATSMAGYPVTAWVVGNLMILFGAMQLWATTIFFCLVTGRSGKPTNPVGPLAVVTGMFWVVVVLVPALGFMLATYTLFVGGFVIVGQVPSTSAAVLIPSAVSVGFAVYWLLAAAAKYRRPDLPALNALYIIVLLGASVFLGAGGIFVLADQGQQAAVGANFDDPNLVASQWLGVWVLAWSLAVVGLQNQVTLARLRREGCRLRSWSDHVPPLLLAVGMALLISGGMFAAGGPTWGLLLGATGKFARPEPQALAYSLLATLHALLGAWALWSIMSPRTPSVSVILGLITLLGWTGATAVDLARVALLDRPPSALFGFCPLGTLTAVWVPALRVPLAPGLAVQAIAVTVLVVLAALMGNVRRSAGTEPMRPASLDSASA